LNCISIMMSFLTYITAFFYELWNFTDFDRLCKLEKRGDEIKKIFPSEFWPFEEISIFSNGGHLGYRTALTDTILKGDHLRIISAKFGALLYPRWPPLLKIEISSNGQNCSILSQKVPKFELYKHNDELFNIYYVGDHLRIISAKFGWNWLSSFRGEDFF
jgi:hypothetical protein